MSEKSMIFQVCSTEAALICTAKIVNASYSPDIFDDMANRTKKAFLEILPQVLDGEDVEDIKTSAADVDVSDYGTDFLK